jgi:hypothetical protein
MVKFVIAPAIAAMAQDATVCQPNINATPPEPGGLGDPGGRGPAGANNQNGAYGPSGDAPPLS